MAFPLDKTNRFPHPHLAEDDGFLAFGGDLSVNRLLHAYSSGIFPWFEQNGQIFWYATNPRFVIFPEKVKVSKSMKKMMRNTDLTITQNQAFSQVIRECANVQRAHQDSTWINKNFIFAYERLHKHGYAISIEVWRNTELVGGLYGVSLYGTFMGESMFHKESNTSKLGFIHLCQSGQFRLIDCQTHSNHLESLGGEFIPFDEYMKILKHKD